MPADNPSHILRLLDAKLDHKVELTLIGKSALWLGFDNAPTDFGKTLDVDGVVSADQSAAFDTDMGFWDALRNTNQELAALGLYLSHIFEEEQIILTRNWLENRARISRPTLQHLVLYRPSALDLEEISWLLRHEGI